MPPTEEETKAFIAYMNQRCKMHFAAGAAFGFLVSLLLLKIVG